MYRTDRERFELSIPRKRYAGFRDRCLQPLGHLSNRAAKASQAKKDGQRRELARFGKRPGFGPPRSKKARQYGAALLSQDARDDLGTVIEARVAEEVAYRPRHAGLLIPGTEDDAAEPREHDRARTHGAGLERHHQRAVVQPPAT
jgi:hypothetical protein